MLLAVGTEKGVLTLQLTGQTWSLAGQGLYGQQVADLIPAVGGGIFACASNGRVYHTRDGEAWESLFEGLTGQGVHALAQSVDGSMLFAGTSPPAVFRSLDQGRHWSVMAGFGKVSGRDGWSCSTPPYRPRVCRLACTPTGVLVAGVEEGGLLVSPDAGRRWAERWTGLPPSVTDLAVHPAVPERILVTTRLGIHQSLDLGGSWSALKTGIPYDLTRGLAIDPRDPALILAGMSKTPQSGAALVRSRDSGRTWEVATRGLPPFKDECFTRFLCGPECQFAATNRGQLFWSQDFADLWVKVGVKLPPIHSLLVQT